MFRIDVLKIKDLEVAPSKIQEHQSDHELKTSELLKIQEHLSDHELKTSELSKIQEHLSDHELKASEISKVQELESDYELTTSEIEIKDETDETDELIQTRELSDLLNDLETSHQNGNNCVTRNDNATELYETKELAQSLLPDDTNDNVQSLEKNNCITLDDEKEEAEADQTIDFPNNNIQPSNEDEYSTVTDKSNQLENQFPSLDDLDDELPVSLSQCSDTTNIILPSDLNLQTCGTAMYSQTTKVIPPSDLNLQSRETGMEAFSNEASDKFSCDLCNFLAASSFTLKQHKASLHKVIRHQCDECNYSVPALYTLKRHKELCLKRHKELKHKRQFKCDQCSYASTKHGVRLHSIKKHGQRFPRLTCTLCEFTVNSHGEIFSHKRICHDILQYPCDKCDNSAAKNQQLKHHKYNIHGEISYSHELCDFTTTSTTMSTASATLDEIVIHRNKHDAIRFPCDQCDYSTTKEVYLQVHKDKLHRGIVHRIINRCGHCEFSATTPEEISLHEKAQHDFPDNSKEEESYVKGTKLSGIKYKCDHCDYTAPSLHLLKKHKDDEHKEIIHTCGGCDFTATTLEDINWHIQIRHGTCHRCYQCDFVASSTERLEQHKKNVHNSIRYHCDQCDFFFWIINLRSWPA